MPTLVVERLVVTIAEANAYIVGCGLTGEGLVVDPGAEEDRILARAAELGITLRLAVVTHAHWDHLLAAGPLQERLGIPVAMHPSDEPLLDLVPARVLERTGRPSPPLARITRPLREGDLIEVGESVRLRVWHTPGHTPGSICLVDETCAFTADTLMPGWVGRTDGPGGDQAALRASVFDRLLGLPDDRVVYPGHLEPTTIGQERRHNPYLTGALPLR